MRPLPILIATGAVVVLAAGGYLYARQQAQTDFDQAVAQIRAGLPPGSSLTYAASDVHPFTRSADLASVALREPSGVLVTAGHVTLAGAASDRLSALHATGLRFTGPGGAGTVAALDMTDLTGPMTTPGRPAGFDPSTLTFASLRMRDIALSAPRPATIASVEVRDFGLGRHSTATVAGVAVPVADAQGFDRAGFGSLTVTGPDAAAILGAAEHKLPAPAAASPQMRVVLDGLYVARGATPVSHADRLIVTVTSRMAGSASSASLVLTGVSAVPNDAAARAELQSIGLDRISGNLSSNMNYDTAGGMMSIAPIILQVAGLGTLITDLQFSHVDIAAFAHGKPSQADIERAAGGVELVTFESRFSDAGLLDRLFALGSKRTGSTPTQLRDAAAARVSGDPTLAALAGGDSARAALASFLQHGGNLFVAMHPASPVNLFALAATAQSDPAAAFGQLGLTVHQTGGAGPVH